MCARNQPFEENSQSANPILGLLSAFRAELGPHGALVLAALNLFAQREKFQASGGANYKFNCVFVVAGRRQGNTLVVASAKITNSAHGSTIHCG